MKLSATIVLSMAAISFAADSTSVSTPATVVAAPIVQVVPVCTLTVKTIPDSVQLVVGDSVLGVTPCTIVRTAGAVKIALKKKGFYQKTADLDLATGSNQNMTFELLAPATLVLSSTPSGASVILDGNPQGVTPITIGKVKPAAHTLVVSLSGYQTVTKSVEPKNSAIDTLTIALVPVASVKTATVDSIADKSKHGQTKKVGKILDAIAVGVFLVFSLAIVGIELAHN